MKAVTAATMRELDRATIAAGTPADLLMERAGRGAAEAILEFLGSIHPDHAERLAIVTGKGNNGGDGFVVARIAADEWGLETAVYALCPPEQLTGDAARNAARLPESVSLTVTDRLPPDALRRGTVLVDAMLGTGVRGPLREPFATVVRQINRSRLPVVALDIPSGVNGDTGEVADDAVVADLTVTFGNPKAGLFLDAGARHAGRKRCIDIGIDTARVDAADACFETTFAADVATALDRLHHHAHKGTMGRILVVGGCDRYPGAPVLAALGAIRCGAGLVTLAYPAAIANAIQTGANALIRRPLPDRGEGHHLPHPEAFIDELLGPQDVAVVGPGLGQHPESLQLAAQILESDKPVVLDADGLMVAAGAAPLRRPALTVLTPHPGEMRRLLQHLGHARLIDAPRLHQAAELAAACDAFIILKGQNTVVAAPDGRTAVNASGCPALATAGTGDVLAGVLAAFIHQNDTPWDALRLGVFLHGLAAELHPTGQRHCIADDLPALIGEAMHQLAPFA